MRAHHLQYKGITAYCWLQFMQDNGSLPEARCTLGNSQVQAVCMTDPGGVGDVIRL